MVCDFPDLGDWGGKRPPEIEEVAAERAESLAWSAMAQLTSGRIALCPITVRPRVTLTTDAAVLPLAGPIGKVVSVSVNGALRAPSTYRVEDEGVRDLTNLGWVLNSDFTTAVAAIEVTYYQGLRAGASYVWATGQLAAEFYLAMSSTGKGRGGSSCRLPDNVTQVTRQGVSYTVATGSFTGGVTGIREIDAVVRRYNPNLLQQATVIASVDSLASRPLRTA